MFSVKGTRRGNRFVMSILTVGLLAVGCFALIALALTRTTSAALDAGSWPALTLVYQIEANSQGLDAPADITTWKVTYHDKRHWRKELLADSANTNQVGTVESFQGTTYTVHSGRAKRVVFTQEYPDAPMAPERWLFPGREQALVSEKGYQKALSPDGTRAIYTKTEAIPCQPDEVRGGRRVTGVLQPAICATSPTYQATETIVYRVDLGVPIELLTQLEGTIVQRVGVTQLQVTAP